MEKSRISFAQSLSIAYECTLAIGNSLSLAEMLHQVIHTMVRKTNALRGTIWVKDGGKELQPVASAGIRISDVPAEERIGSLRSVLKQIQQGQRFVIRTKDDKDFLQHLAIVTGKEEAVLIVPVNDVALLHLVYAGRERADETLGNLLASLSPRLNVAIAACVAHENIIKEIRVREETENALKKKTDQLISSQEELQRLYAESEEARRSLVSILEDVSEKENALRESEEKYRSLIEQSPDAIYLLDEGRFELINRRFEELFGYTLKETSAPDFHFMNLVAPKSRALVEERLRKISRGEAVPPQYEFTALSRDGTEIEAEISVSYIQYKGGIIAQGILRDITERKRMEQIQSALYGIGNAANTTRDLDELYRSIHHHLGTILDTTNLFIALYHRKSDTISLAYLADTRQTVTSFPSGKTFTSYVIRTGKSQLIGQELGDKLVQAGELEWVGLPSKSWLGVPLKIEDEVMGVVVVQSYTDASLYTEKDVTVLEFVSGQIALAIERKRAERKIQHLTDVLRAIRNVNQLITREKDRQRLLKGVCETLIEARGYNNAWVATFGESGELVTWAEAGFGTNFLPLLEHLRSGELPICAREALGQSNVVVMEVTRSTCADCPLGAEHYGIKTMTVRLEHAGKVYGLLTVSSLASLNAGEEEQTLFREVAGDIAFALHSIELEEERKRAEENLKKAEEKYRSLVTNVKLGIYRSSTGPSGKLLEVNPAMAEILGCSGEEELLRMNAIDFYVHPEERETLHEEGSAIGGEQGITREIQLKRKDGTEISVADTMVAVRDEAGKVLYFDGILEDITERKRAERKIQHLTDVLRAIRNVNQLITREKDRQRLLKGVCETLIEARGYNNAWVATFGESGELVMWAEAGFGEGFLPLLEHLRGGELPICGPRALRESEVVVIEDTLLDCIGCPLSEGHHERASMIVRLEHAGKVYGLLTVSSTASLDAGEEEQTLFREVAGDIAFALHSIELEEKRKRAEEDLAASEERYRGLVTNVKLGVFRHSKELKGLVLEANPAMEEITGYSRQELLGMKVTDLYVHPEERLVLLEELAATREKVAKELRWRKKDGSEITVAVTKVAVRDDAGDILHIDGILEDITERKRAEEALRESEESYRALVNMGAEMGEALVVLQDNELGEGIQTFANDEWPRITGYSRKKLLGMSFFDLVHPKHREASRERHRKKMSGEVIPGLFDISIITRDGTEVVVELTSAYTTYKGKRANVCYIRDITERKRMQREIEEQREYLAAVLRDAPDAIVSLDASHRILEWNSGAESLFGYTYEEVQGKDLDDLVTRPDVRAEAKFFAKQSLSGAKVGPLETVRYRKDGTPVNVILSGSPIIIRHKVVGAVAVYTDITERKRAEEALQQAHDLLEIRVEERTRDLSMINEALQVEIIERKRMGSEIEKQREYLASVLRDAPDAIVTFDTANRIVEWNPGAERLYGYSSDDVRGKNLDDVVTHHDCPEMREEATFFTEQLLHFGKVIPPTETVRCRKDGTLASVILAGSPIRIGDELHGAVIVYTDISERKRAEEALRAKEMQLIHAGRLSSLGEMATGVAHEINQPLAIISMVAEGRLRDIERGRFDVSILPQELKDILKNVRRIDRIITHMRTFARRAGEWDSVGPEEMLDNVFTLLGEQFRMHEISISREIAADLPAIRVDVNQLEQVFVNILTNARQVLDERAEEAEREGKVFKKRLICGISRVEEEAGEYVVFEFADNAYGVPDELKTRVFDPFFTTKEAGEGTGLGLSIAYTIVTHALGGRIWVEDNEMGGASFKVALRGKGGEVRG